MKTTTCAIMAGCLVMLAGTICLAAEAAVTPPKEPQQVAEVGINTNSDNLRGWVNSIKPAAGKTDPVHQESGYWKQTVRRQDRGHMQE